MEAKLKHLEFIQSIINRMNSNSFMIKGWTITLISALFVLAEKDSNLQYAIVSYIIIPVFWVLDGFYISQEKKYRELYKIVTTKKEEEIDFSLDATGFNKEENSWICGILSKTIVPFYAIAVVATIIIMYFIKK